MKRTKQKATIEQVIRALLDNDTPFSPTWLHRFSDLESSDLDKIKKIWLQINPERRLNLLRDLEDLAEADTLVSFDNLARFALEDSDMRVRAAAIDLLWECEDRHLAPVFLHMLEEDESPEVRAAAAKALGLFVYLGELEEIPETMQRQIEDALLDQFTSNEPKAVRLNALESLGYSQREEVIPLIQNAYFSNDTQWMSSALCAMGRSADPRWEPIVLKALDSPTPAIQVEAVRAAGELELKSARQPLLEMLENPEALDQDVYFAAIWSLSQIGGESVRETLEGLLDETEDDEEIDLLETALENLEFTEDDTIFQMFNFDIADEEDLRKASEEGDENQ
ncbi:MAG: HEAT repeat domain-containing protein [Anaerolineales bacterium]